MRHSTEHVCRLPASAFPHTGHGLIGPRFASQVCLRFSLEASPCEALAQLREQYLPFDVELLHLAHNCISSTISHVAWDGFEPSLAMPPAYQTGALTGLSYQASSSGAWNRTKVHELQRLAGMPTTHTGAPKVGIEPTYTRFKVSLGSQHPTSERVIHVWPEGVEPSTSGFSDQRSTT